MRFKIIPVIVNKAKATIQYSGRLGFNMDAIQLIDLERIKSFLIAQDEDDEEILYLLPQNDGEGDAKVARAGQYYYLNVGDVFKNLGLKYKEYTIMYEVEKMEHEEKTIYALREKRQNKRKDKE
jgi:hypothetical protein